MRALIRFALFVVVFFFLLFVNRVRLDLETLGLGRGDLLLTRGGLLRVEVAEGSCARVSKVGRGRSAAGRTHEAS